MDVKSMLMDALEADGPLRLSKRFYVQKKCYIMWFEMSGKYLTITKVKQFPKKSTPQTRIQRRKRQLEKALPQPYVVPEPDSITTIITPAPAPGKDAQTQTSSKVFVNRETQTLRTLKGNKGTETDLFFSISRASQTTCKLYHKETTQTEWIANSIGTQSEWMTTKRCTQTEGGENRSAATQVDISCSHAHMQTDPHVETVEQMQAERVIIAGVLHEVGEMMINQNHLLQNNSTILSQLSEFMMLNTMASTKRSHVNYIRKMTRQKKIRRMAKRRAKFRFVYRCRRCQMVTTRTTFAQTDKMACFLSNSVATQVDKTEHTADESTQTIVIIKRSHVAVQVGYDKSKLPRKKFYKLFQT